MLTFCRFPRESLRMGVRVSRPMRADRASALRKEPSPRRSEARRKSRPGLTAA